jgi:hypothetical protein
MRDVRATGQFGYNNNNSNNKSTNLY